MQRVLVMGCPGAGKSTFARALADKLAVPLVSIDRLYWQPGWREPKTEDFTATMTDEAAKPAWVMDGNYVVSGAGDLRRERAQAIVWFDLPRLACLSGALRRIVPNYGTVRAEMAPGCPERFDWAFMKYIWTYRARQRPMLVSYLDTLRSDQPLAIFRSRAQASAYLAHVGIA